jgi:Bacterial regulatory proteins, luxR family
VLRLLVQGLAAKQIARRLDIAVLTVGNHQRQTLGLVLISPARRIPLFLGRSLPVIFNGWGRRRWRRRRRRR